MTNIPSEYKLDEKKTSKHIKNSDQNRTAGDDSEATLITTQKMALFPGFR